MSGQKAVNLTGRGELVADLVATIESRGPITFAEFMETALYHPRHGYYTVGRVPWSGSGDYLTTPHCHPAVGRSIGRWICELDGVLSAPEPLTLVEVGGGDGTLMADVWAELVSAAGHELARRIRLVSVERSARNRDLQRRRLGALGAPVTFCEELASLSEDAIVGGIFSNELIDAFPVHRVARIDGELRELLVDWEEGAFVERPAEPTTDELDAYLTANRIELAEGGIAEINLEAGRWMRLAASRLRRGFLLTIDYGADGRTLFDPITGGSTLVCQRRFRLGADPFVHVGEQDITAHVDFGNLRRVGESMGLAAMGPVSLAAFLVGLGAAAGVELRGAEETVASASKIRDALGLRHLLFSEVGDAHRVLVQLAGIDPGAVSFGMERLE